MELTIRIEIPKHSKIKYEFDNKKNQLIVDRILRDKFVYPQNYGSISKTLDWDGDELDVLVISDEKFFPGSFVRVRVIGAMKMIDDGEIDTKLIAVHKDDYRLEKIITLEDLEPQTLEEISYFFSNYKNWKRPNITKVEGFENLEFAQKEFLECQKLYQKFHHLTKQEFLQKMKEIHPEKYC